MHVPDSWMKKSCVADSLGETVGFWIKGEISTTAAIVVSSHLRFPGLQGWAKDDELNLHPCWNLRELGMVEVVTSTNVINEKKW